MMDKPNGINNVTVWQSGKATYGDVRFEHRHPLSWYQAYKYVTKASMVRLARAINSLNMTVELDEYGVPTWTRKEGGE